MIYESGQAVTLGFPITLAEEPDSVIVLVENEDGDVVARSGVGGVSMDISAALITITVQASANALPNGATQGYRLVRLLYTAPDEFAGQRSLEHDYRLLSGPPLAVQVNSFQHYNQAMMLAAGMTGIDAFKQAAREDRIAALQDAWLSLVRLRYVVEPSSDMTRLTDAPGRHAWDLSELREEELNGFDHRFVRALHRAQILEADNLLAGGDVQSRRLQGILSSTIGETSQMFRSSKPVEYVVSRRTLQELRGYVSFSVRLARGA